MATIKQGVMGGFSGTVGTVIGGNWNGIDYMRGKSPDRKDAASSAQLEQRARFKTIIRFLKPLKPFLQIGFKKRKEGLTAYNAAASCNLKEALLGVYPDYSIDFSKVKVSEGSMPGVLNPLAVAKEGSLIEFSWQDNSTITYAMASDKSILVAYNEEKSKVVISRNSQLRINESHTLTLPDDFAGDTIHCYIAFQNANETLVSDSQYAGTVSLL